MQKPPLPATFFNNINCYQLQRCEGYLNAHVVMEMDAHFHINLKSYLTDLKTFIKFAIVGSSGVFINLMAFTLLVNAGINKFIASPVAIELSILSNFFFNNIWTFKERNTKNIVPVKGLKFNIVSLSALCISFLTFMVLSFLFPGVLPQIHQTIGIVPAVFVNYFLNSCWTFKENAPAGAKSDAD